MPSSFLKPLSTLLLLAIGVFACRGPQNAWHVVTAVDNGGFQVEMPRPAGVQHGTIYLNTDPVETHINILADSGITYVASWFDLPESLVALPTEALADSVWTLLHQDKHVTMLDEETPWSGSDAEHRSTWLLAEDGTRLGTHMIFEGKRVMILNAGTPGEYFGERERANIVRFLSSHRFQ
jgi:hypothetical protein